MVNKPRLKEDLIERAVSLLLSVPRDLEVFAGLPYRGVT